VPRQAGQPHLDFAPIHPVAVRLLPDAGEHFLQDVIGQAAIPHDLQGDAENQPVIAVVQLPQRRLVAPADHVEQRLIAKLRVVQGHGRLFLAVAFCAGDTR